MNDQAVNPIRTRDPDPNVQLPAAVLRAAQRATELSNQLKTGGMAITDIRSELPPVAPTPSSKPTSRLPDVPPPSPPPPPAHTNSESNRQDNRQDSRQDNQEPVTYNEQQYKSMQGRFERAQQDNQQLLRRINEMNNLLAYMNTPAPQQGNGGVPSAVSRLITDKERTEFGEELIDVIGRRAREVVEPEINALRAENERLQRALGGVQQAGVLTARQQFYQELKKEVPDYEEIQATPEFDDWIKQIEPMSGNQRWAILRNAFEQGSASRAISAFKSYKAEQAALSPAQDRSSRSGNGAESSRGNGDLANRRNSESNPATTPTVDLMNLAAPGRARSAAANPAPSDKPMVLGSEISQFYKDKALGKYMGREDEVRLIERQIQEALQDGRIIRGR